ncbi:MAG: hypothetical protein ACRDV8_02910, partial [Acidimicrobiales bacterium]
MSKACFLEVAPRSRRRSASLVLGAATLAGSLVLVAGPIEHAGASGTVLYASPTGSGTTCTTATPCSLATALSKVPSGVVVTLELAPGTYKGGDFTVHGAASALTIEPEVSGSSVILSGTGVHPVLAVDGVTTIKDLTIETGNAGTGGGGDIHTT